MPTAAKLVAALVMAGLAYGVSYLWVVHANPGGLDAAFRIGWFKEINAALGFWLGWRILGRGAGETLWLSVTSALLTGAALVVAALLTHSFVAMIKEALGSRYSSPEQAVEAVMGFVVRFFVQSMQPEVWGALALGTVAAGGLTHVAARTWR